MASGQGPRESFRGKPPGKGGGRKEGMPEVWVWSQSSKSDRCACQRGREASNPRREANSLNESSVVSGPGYGLIQYITSSP